MNGNENRLTLSGKALAQQLSVSLRHVRRFDSAAKIPRPIRLGNSVRWLCTEIEEWLQAGAPDRQRWEEIKGGEDDA